MKNEKGNLKGPKVIVLLEVKNKEGEIIKTVEQEAHSWGANYYIWLSMMFGRQRADNFYLSNPEVMGRPCIAGNFYGETSWDNAPTRQTKIAIGDGDDAEDILLFCLDSLIDKSAIKDVVFDWDSKKIVLEATFTISGDQTIKETGILFTDVTDTLGAVFECYIERTVLDTEVDVPDGATLTVKYTISH